MLFIYYFYFVTCILCDKVWKGMWQCKFLHRKLPQNIIKNHTICTGISKEKKKASSNEIIRENIISEKTKTK